MERRLESLEDALSQAPTTPVFTTPVIEPFTAFKSIPFQADEVGYFDPDLDADAKGDMVIIRKDLWFRDVFLLFIRHYSLLVSRRIRGL
jgi:hypothetical protein